MTLRRSVTLAAAVALLSGCTGASTGGSVAHPTPVIHTVVPVHAPSTIPVGPVPPAVYTVQTFPAPGTCHYRWEGKYPLPDPKCTPGALNPLVTQANIHTTVCIPTGSKLHPWRTDKTIIRRPPVGITQAEKRLVAASYGYTGNLGVSEGDHFVMEAGGGEPNDARNYWVEPPDDPNATSTANSKDLVEDAAYNDLCTGKVTLAQLQNGLAADWVKFGRSIGVNLP